MKPISKLGTGIVAAAVLVTAGVALTSSPAQEGAPPALPAQPNAALVSLIAAQPFEVDEALTHWYRRERPLYTHGTLVVLDVPLDVVHPRQTYEPVLYVGAETAERVNTGHESGYLVAIVPGDVDLSQAPIFFGDPELPERIDAAEAERQLELAQRNGVRSFTAAEVAAVTRPTLGVGDGQDLYYFASELVEEFSPIEVDLINGLRAERVR